MHSNLLEILESVAMRPAMYVGHVTYKTVRSYLGGLHLGLRWAGIEYTEKEYLAAATARGWDPDSPIGIEADFRKHELTEGAMITELVTVEREAYRLALDRLGRTGDFPG